MEPVDGDGTITASNESDAMNREPVETTAEDDETEPASDDFTKGYSVEMHGKGNESDNKPDANDREPADLLVKNRKEDDVSGGEDLCVRPFRLDSMETVDFQTDPRTVRKESLTSSNMEPAQETRKLVDFTALGFIISNNNNNNNNIDQCIMQQLLSNRSVATGDGDLQATKKKKARIRKRRSDSNGSPGSEIPGIGSGLPADPASPPVTLEVVCGQNQASLSIDKLRTGSKTACVLLNGTWLTPNQYQHVSGRGTARDWKRSIKHNGTSLKALLASKVLTFEPPLCRCNLCGITASAKRSNESVKLTIGVDQENRPPRELDFTSGGNGKPIPGLRIPMEALPATGTVRQSPEDTIKVSDDDDDDEEEDDDEDEEEEEEATEDGNEEKKLEEEEFWSRKRAFMLALGLVELPSATVAAAAAAESQLSRKRKSVQSDIRSIKRKKSDKESVSSSSSGGVGASVGNESVRGGPAVASKTPGVGGCAAGVMVAPSGVARPLTLAPGVQLKSVQSFQKEETLNSIIHELRNYKKSLEEKIVAGRRTSGNNQDTISGLPGTVQRYRIVPHSLWSAPTPTSGQHRGPTDVDERARATAGCGRKDWTLRAPTKSEGSDERLLPDLVRSLDPSTSTVATTSGQAVLSSMTPKTYSLYAMHPLSSACLSSACLSSACLSSTCHYVPRTRYVVDPQNGAKYECDESGAIDLRVRKNSPMAPLPFQPLYPRALGRMNADREDVSDEEKVIDLSASSKVKVKVEVKPATREEERAPRRKRWSDGHSRRLVHKQTWPGSAVRMLAWSVTDVTKFVAEVPGCSAYAETFKQFGITGTSLVCLSVDQMTAILRMCSDAAQSLRSAIDRLLATPPSPAPLVA